MIAALVTICLLLMAAAVGLLILYLRGQERGEEKEAPEPIAPTTYDSDVTPRERLEQRRKTMKEVPRWNHNMCARAQPRNKSGPSRFVKVGNG